MPIDSEPPPTYLTWDDYLARTTQANRRARAQRQAAKANRKRLASAAPDVLLSADDVLGVMIRAEGRCARCGSLAVEPRPSNERGHPLPWEAVGRRIGSLGHVQSRASGGSNGVENLEWSCLWCNTWPNQGVMGATDHGGIQDPSTPAATAPKVRFTADQVSDLVRVFEVVPDQGVGIVLPEDTDPVDRDPFAADTWAEITDPDDEDYLRGTAMSRD